MEHLTAFQILHINSEKKYIDATAKSTLELAKRVKLFTPICEMNFEILTAVLMGVTIS